MGKKQKKGKKSGTRATEIASKEPVQEPEVLLKAAAAKAGDSSDDQFEDTLSFQEAQEIEETSEAKSPEEESLERERSGSGGQEPGALSESKEESERVDVAGEDGSAEDESAEIYKGHERQKLGEAEPQSEEKCFSLSENDVPGLSASTATPVSVSPAYISGESLLEARQSVISVKFDDKDLSQQQAITSGAESIKNTFRDIKNTIGHLPPGLFGAKPIDWEFWATAVEDYHAVVHTQQEELLAAVAAGIPLQIRGIIWQLVAQLKNLHLEELYLHLKTEPSAHEKAIKKDLARTSFYASIEAANKTHELYNVIAAYSNFDPDVGYTQGMVFIVVPLIMNMTEAECFCLLVTLMKEYGLRQLFLPEMRGLHLLLYQYDRLLEKNLPLLYNHLCMQGVRLLMYASQWFLTFFSYKFPLNVVLRIFDMIITQGVEAVLRLGLNLVLRNEQHLLRLSFDALVDFLKTNLFEIYSMPEEEVENKRFSLLSLKAQKKSDTKSDYKLDAFILDLMRVEVSPRELALFSAEFDEIMALDVSRTDDIDGARAHNEELRQRLADLEQEHLLLDQAHLDHVLLLVEVKVKLPEIVNEITDLREAVTSLQAKMQDLGLAAAEVLPQDIEAEIQALLGKNAQETERFAALDEEFNRLTLEEEQLDDVLLKNKKWFW